MVHSGTDIIKIAWLRFWIAIRTQASPLILRIMWSRRTREWKQMEISFPLFSTSACTSGNKWQKLETDTFSRMTQPAAAPEGRGRPFQSRLIPHVEWIRAWRREGRQWRNNAEILTEQGCKTSASSAYKFMVRFRRRPYSSEAEPEGKISPAIRHATFQPMERELRGEKTPGW